MGADNEISNIVRRKYHDLVIQKYPESIHSWPLLSGFDIINGQVGDYLICIFKDTGNPLMVSSSVVGFNFDSIGVTTIGIENIEIVRAKIKKDYRLNSRDSILVINKYGNNIDNELEKLLFQHEIVMGVIKMKVFLSHKSIDKDLVREIKKTLEILGFDPWLDEDSMVAGVPLERSILQGFKDSCAAVFFVTPNFKDEDYLGSEVNYAIAEKRKKNKNFAIITLVLELDGEIGVVPELLTPYVYKSPTNELGMIQEIVKALPIKLGAPNFV